jgi:hypothetical protein
MKQKLATLNVWLDTEESDQVSCLRSNLADKQYDLYLHPAADGQESPKGFLENIRSVATIFAHELGHFVAYVLKSPWQSCPVQVFAEKEAWDIAKRIQPDLDQELAAWAFKSYAEPKCTCGHPECAERVKRSKPPQEVIDGLTPIYEMTKVVV